MTTSKRNGEEGARVPESRRSPHPRVEQYQKMFTRFGRMYGRKDKVHPKSRILAKSTVSRKVDLSMSKESVNAPILIIDLISDGETEKTLWEEVAKIDKRTTLTRKRLADAEQKMTNILKPSNRISGFEHHTRRPFNEERNFNRNSGTNGTLSSEQALRARGVLHLIDERPPECIPANAHKIYAYHAGQPVHTMDECLDLKARQCMMIDDGKITQWGGSHTTITYDQIET
ncbi:hypothetical protein HAX54_015539 [Datura stramonium]|uniref:Uncharacterized protein n=1 Tax=Datura stramonium TaxID=4076 RepID=A0ABS8TSI2_DATST|nr:hypothetical protein [Datura stramonium]